METISIDIETYSGNDLNKCGVYKYVQHPDFDILLFGYAVDGGKVHVVDLAAGEEIPDEVLAALSDEDITKWAFNSNFERVCLSEWLRRNRPEYFSSYSVRGDYLNPHGWKCSMIWSAYMGLPLSLADVGAVLGLEEQKLKEGKDLIRYFCVPCKATKSNGGRLSELKPYENNPRINDEAVDDVAESIRQCSYIAPIVIDEDGVYGLLVIVLASQPLQNDRT